MLTRRRFLALSGLAASSACIPARTEDGTPDVRLEIAPYTLEASPRHRFRTMAYNGQVPGPLLRMHEGEEQRIEIRNASPDPEVLHWHGLYLPPEIDGAMEEGTPMIAPGATVRYSLRARPAGLRWYHTHASAGRGLTRAQYGGQHGLLMIEPRESPGSHDRELFLALHDWGGHMQGSDDGSMDPVYEVSTINGRMLGWGEPLRVKQGERVLMHILNSSPTEVHWIALAGHSLRVVALDGNPLGGPVEVPMLRLAPAERVSAMVEMSAPGVWVLGEVRRHIQARGMGIVLEYAGAGGAPLWNQPDRLDWDYRSFAAQGREEPGRGEATPIELVFDARFEGHGSEEMWRINGRSWPHTEEPVLREGVRYRLVLRNLSADDHPLHLHRHTFEVCRIAGDGGRMRGVRKDVVLVGARSTAEIEFLAEHPGRTLFHCHQQNHMDRGFMMVFRYA